MRRKNERKAKRQGMNWISQHKRLAIYIRDGLSCAWCGVSVEDGVTLTLDHLRPYIKGGSNDANNLVCCCKNCNESRGDRPLTEFARVVAQYRNHGVTPEAILNHIHRTSRRSLRNALVLARELVEHRGSCARALENYRRS